MKRFKGLLIVVMVAALLFASVPVCSAAQVVEVINDGSQITVKVNGNQVNLPQQPIISNGRTLVPFRAVAEALGCEVSWDAVAMKVTITGSKTVELVIGSSTALVDGKQVFLDAPAIVNSGRTLVPLRFVGEALGAEVTYTPPPGQQVQDSTITDPRVGPEIRKIKELYPDTEITIDGGQVVAVCYGMVPFDSLGGKKARVSFMGIHKEGNRFIIFQDEFGPEAWDTLFNVLNAILPGSSEKTIAVIKSGNPNQSFKYGGRTITIEYWGTIFIEIK